MTTKTLFILRAVQVAFWLIFIGLCIKTGALLTSFFVSLFVSEAATKNLYMGLNLSELYQFGVPYYIAIAAIQIVVTGLQAYTCYWVIKIFYELKMDKPFSAGVQKIISKISRFALVGGFFALAGQFHSSWIMKSGVAIPVSWPYAEMLFFAGVVYIIAELFRRGIELQTENELTV